MRLHSPLGFRSIPLAEEQWALYGGQLTNNLSGVPASSGYGPYSAPASNPNFEYTGSPQTQAKLHTYFALPADFGFTIGLRWSNAYWHNFDHTLRLPSSLNVDASISWRRDDWDVALHGSNLTDADIYTGAEPVFAANTLLTKAPGPEAKLVLTRRFLPPRPLTSRNMWSNNPRALPSRDFPLVQHRVTALPMLRVISALLVATIFAGCSKTSGPSSDSTEPASTGSRTPITVQLDWVAEPEHGGFYQAQARGFFTDAGLGVTLIQGGPNAFPMQKVATNQAQFAQADSTNTILAINQGLPITQVAAVFQQNPSVLMLHADNPISSFEELDGKTIMARPEWAFLPYLRQKYGISFELIPFNFSVANFIADTDFIQQGFYIAEPFFIEQGGGQKPQFLYAWDAGFDSYVVLVANRT
ncbi:MAG: ABC transporter substrate-binding protein [Candidatus Synoicihabitans palmerolidicus]|nr:ABC transporter substrate-binding protein [Candidatus Synoicihabitans palmerolidicus]